MDPDACLMRMCDALDEGDTDEARYAAVDLRAWVHSGGALPHDSCALLTREGWVALLTALVMVDAVAFNSETTRLRKTLP